jgi:hypothetical protein
VDEAGQSTEALWWPLGYADCMWPRIVVVKKHFCLIFMGTNPPETLLQCFHIDVRVDRLASARCISAGVTAVDGRPERGRSGTFPCPCSDDTSRRFAQRLTVILSTAVSP